MNISKKTPKVSVCVVTYNQENYIKQCLQSVVGQERDFEIEVIVSDDCSTDSTPNIVQEFAEKYDFIIPVLHKKNIGALTNFVETHNMANGKYICHLDGDDYWLQGKLNAQVEYLDKNKTCSIVWHRMKIDNGANDELIDDFNINTDIKEKKFYRKDILLIGSIGCNSSKMYRFNPHKSSSKNTDVIDFFMDVQQVGDGYAAIIDNRLGVYRKGVGITSGTMTKQLYLSHLEEFSKIYPEYKYEIAANAFLVFLADFKNKRKSYKRAFRIFTKVNPIFVLPRLIKLYFEMKNFRARS